MMTFFQLALALITGASTSCSSSTPLPEPLAKACYLIPLSGDRFVKSEIYANITDMFEAVLSAPDASLSIDGSEQAPIVRASFTEEFSQRSKKLAFQFNRADVDAEPDQSVAISDHCGPAIFKITRASVDGVDLSPMKIAQLVGQMISDSTWKREGPRLWASAETAPTQAPAIPEAGSEDLDPSRQDQKTSSNQQCAKSDSWLEENGYDTEQKIAKFFAECDGSAVSGQDAMSMPTPKWLAGTWDDDGFCQGDSGKRF